jgi:hypothetical protein
VRYGEILGVKSYSGDWRVHFDSQVIERAIESYTSAPAAYGADFGVTAGGETLLIEVNDGYALGAYGLFSADYARLLASRWAQMAGTQDLSIY